MPDYPNPAAAYEFKGIHDNLAHVAADDTAVLTTVPLRRGTKGWQVNMHTFAGTKLHDAVMEAVRALCEAYNKTAEGGRLDPQSVMCSDGTASIRLAFKLQQVTGLGGSRIKARGKTMPPEDVGESACAIKPVFINLGLNTWVDDKGKLQPGLRACRCLFDYDRTVKNYHSIEVDLAKATGFDVVDASSDEDDGLVDTAAAGGAKGKGKKRKIGGR